MRSTFIWLHMNETCTIMWSQLLPPDSPSQSVWERGRRFTQVWVSFIVTCHLAVCASSVINHSQIELFSRKWLINVPVLPQTSTWHPERQQQQTSRHDPHKLFYGAWWQKGFKITQRFNDLCYHSHSDLPPLLNKPYITVYCSILTLYSRCGVL